MITMNSTRIVLGAKQIVKISVRFLGVAAHSIATKTKIRVSLGSSSSTTETRLMGTML